MKKTAAHKGLLLIAVAILLLGGIQDLVACDGLGPHDPGSPKNTVAGADSLLSTKCIKQGKEMIDAPEPAVVELSEPVKPATKQKQPAKTEGPSTNMSFNFLYYLFYKFSATEFFKTPDFSDTNHY